MRNLVCESIEELFEAKKATAASKAEKVSEKKPKALKKEKVDTKKK
jgi:hypothetical protein